MTEYNATKAADYPHFAYATHPTTGQVIVVLRYTSGYHDAPNTNGKTADELNEEIGVSKAMAQAMYAGSMFGWDCPAAHPACYRENGSIKT
jgi:hypothetical protein